MNTKEEIIYLTGGKIRDFLQKINANIFEEAQEIRIRTDIPISIKLKNGNVNSFACGTFKPTSKDISETMETISGYSLYAFNEEIRSGFISVKGGHRVGVSGRVILNEGKVIDIRQISSLNIRISHEIIGCGEDVLPYVYKDKKIKNTMIISPPGCGKTTLLRDLVRLISDDGINVTVIDERSEICQGTINCGINTDVMSGCPKVFGMKMTLRSMSPQVIAVDEIGTREDALAVWEMTCCGVNVICTSHGESLEDILKRREINELIEKKLFDRFVFLQNRDGITGEIKNILDGELKKIWQEDG